MNIARRLLSPASFALQQRLEKAQEAFASAQLAAHSAVDMPLEANIERAMTMLGSALSQRGMVELLRAGKGPDPLAPAVATLREVWTRMPAFTLSGTANASGLPKTARVLEWELETLGVEPFRIRTERVGGTWRAEMRVEWQAAEGGLPRRLLCQHFLSRTPAQRAPMAEDGPHFGLSAWFDGEGCF